LSPSPHLDGALLYVQFSDGDGFSEVIRDRRDPAKQAPAGSSAAGAPTRTRRRKHGIAL